METAPPRHAARGRRWRPTRLSATIGCLFTLVALVFQPSSTRAAVIYDNFDPDGGFHPEFNLTAAYVTVDDLGGLDAAIRAAAQFTVTGGSFTFTSVTLPISVQRNVADDLLRVRLTEDAGGAPGNTLEIMSENQDVWPLFSNPFTTTTTLTSTLNPLLVEGASYWIVTEPTSIPVGGPIIYEDFRWFHNRAGSTALVRQQTAVEPGALPDDPWSGFSGDVNVAFRVEGSPAVVSQSCSAAPAAGCRQPAASKSQLLIKVNATDPVKNKLQWKWNRGATTAKADFGDPTVAEDYHLCIYDAGVLVSTTHILAAGVCAGKPCWKEVTKGYRFKDKALTSDGAQRLELKEGDAGKARVLFRGRGSALELPVLTALAGPVEVQLRQASDLACWSATFSPPFPKQSAALFFDRSD